jgi:5'-nucleotidase
VPQLVRLLQEHGLPQGLLLNVNVPNLPVDQVKGLAVTRMGRSRFVEIFDKRSDPRGNIYYWMDGELEYMGDREHTDLDALERGFVSLTPISTDLTHYEGLEMLRQWDLRTGP